MRKTILATLAFCLAMGMNAQKKAAEIVKKMTLDEKLRMISGGSGFTLYGVERLGMPSVTMSDATGGVNLSGYR